MSHCILEFQKLLTRTPSMVDSTEDHIALLLALSMQSIYAMGAAFNASGAAETRGEGLSLAMNLLLNTLSESEPTNIILVKDNRTIN